MEEFLQVGVITATHGIHGEVKVFPTTDDPKRFKKLKKVLLDTGREKLELEVEGVKFFKNMVILKFKEYNDINQIEKYRKKEVRRNKRKNLTVNENSVADIVSDWTKIPVKRLTEGETKRLAALEKELHKRVIGQEEAVKAVAQAVKRARHLALLPFVTDMMK